MTDLVKRCACGLAYDRAGWEALPSRGRTDDGEGGQLELRNCTCGSTLAVPADYCSHMECQKGAAGQLVYRFDLTTTEIMDRLATVPCLRATAKAASDEEIPAVVAESP